MVFKNVVLNNFDLNTKPTLDYCKLEPITAIKDWLLLTNPMARTCTLALLFWVFGKLCKLICPFKVSTELKCSVCNFDLLHSSSEIKK